MLVVPHHDTFHEHPNALGSNCALTVREKYKECVRAFGPGATVATVELAKTTRPILGMTPSAYHVSLMNTALKNRLIVQVRAESASGASASEDAAAYIARQQALDAQSRLLRRIHDLGAIDFDTSFKPVAGKLQMFEVNGWLAAHARTVTVLRIWMEVHDQDAFKTAWSEIFRLVATLTGRPLRFKQLHRGGTIRGLNADMEAAPLLAFGDAVWETMTDDRRTKVGDARSTLHYVLRICAVHYNRGIDASCSHLPDTVGSEATSEPPLFTRSRLRNVVRFTSQQQLDELEADIMASRDKALQAWWEHKNKHKWLLPGLIHCLSKIPLDDWHLIPANTNLGEGQHRWNNLHTGVAMLLIESMQKYEQLDRAVALELEQGDTTGMLRNTHNNPVDRYTSQASRHIAATAKEQRARFLDQNVRSPSQRLRRISKLPKLT
ncbi:hypothetical protein HMN09_00148500 [Mycena chlorophos]|uniref:Uncharacterized protein n=1 Tax=Mycena chlorophos TaxID=658473 RepID=A0A8H6TKQ6_MYCCL|nr:hypothetical protein HMN09_00148500 [Mycena chlorophos]